MNYGIPLKREDIPFRFKDFNGIIPVNYELVNKIFSDIISNKPITIHIPFMARMGHISRDELVFLVTLVEWIKPNSIFEIGTFDGLTTANIAINAPANANIFTLDISESDIENSK